MNTHSTFSALLVLAICFSLPARASTADTGATFSFSLKYTETDSSLSANVPTPGNQEFRFRKEPDFGKDRILRRALKTGPKPEDYMGFVLDITNRTLYIDLNQNLDLTDDTKGVIKGEGTRDYSYFRSIRLNLRNDGVDRNYLVDVYYYGQNTPYISVRSTYQGEIELYGQKWRVELQDNLDGTIDRQDQISIMPAASGPEDSRKPPVFHGMQPANSIFLGGRLYQVAFKFGSGSTATADFRETSCTLGELALDAQSVRRLVLEGKALAIVDSPGPQVFLPVDNYRVRAVYLQAAPGQPDLTCNISKLPGVAIASGTRYHLKLGGPLQSAVTVTARGRMLLLNYQLTGAGGESYTVNNPDRGKPPRFAIHKGDRQIATGNFEFG